MEAQGAYVRETLGIHEGWGLHLPQALSARVARTVGTME